MQESDQKTKSPFALLPQFPGNAAPPHRNGRWLEELAEEFVVAVVAVFLVLWLTIVLGVALYWEGFGLGP
jgi:hypothetical protein